MVLAVTVGTPPEIRAQSCPEGWTLTTQTFKYQWNGHCCDVVVKYCFKASSNTLFFEMHSYTIPNPECFGLDPSAPPPIPISTMSQFIRKKIAAAQYASIGSGAMPECPNMALITLDERISQCFEWLPVDPNNIDSWKAVGCDQSMCRRICQICMSTQEDPCTLERLVHIGPCTDYRAETPCGQGIALPPHPPCQRVSCGS
jgi:hypothetical protein